jgi:integrase
VYRHGCGGTCGRSVGFCPDRVRSNPELGETKSNAGKRVIGLPPRLVELLTEHRSVQRGERIAARQVWVDRDWVFASVTGESVVPNSAFHAWKALLRAAGVRELRLHDARHSAATMLLVLGVPERTVMGVMGWSCTSMAARYQHVTDPTRRDVAARMGDL